MSHSRAEAQTVTAVTRSEEDKLQVRRSLRACQGAVLLVDAAEGVAAQTVANFWLAFELGLPLLPVLNKIGTLSMA